jgi:hypothetical protein
VDTFEMPNQHQGRHRGVDFPVDEGKDHDRTKVHDQQTKDKQDQIPETHREKRGPTLQTRLRRVFSAVAEDFGIVLPIIRKMKWLLAVFTGIVVAGTLTALESPLTADELSLSFRKDFLRTDDQGHGYLSVWGEDITAAQILTFTPWDLMDLVQTLSGEKVPLSRMGNGGDLTDAWRQKVVAFVRTADHLTPPAPEDIFDPRLVLWDPGYIQFKNAWGQWSIHLENRDIVQTDIPTLSPLEVKQAVEVLTARTYPAEFVLLHLEQFRAQLSIVPRSMPALAGHQ